MKPEVELFKALSDETRIRIMKLLTAFNKPICVCEIVDSLNLPQYLISRHLNILRRAGLVEDSRNGTWVSYTIPNQPTALIYQLIEAIKQNLEEQVFEEDHHRLKLRLRLRQGGRCVVGYDNQRCLKLTRKLKKSKKRS
jgi:ArsR family transcriptional regulator